MSLTVGDDVLLSWGGFLTSYRVRLPDNTQYNLLYYNTLGITPTSKQESNIHWWPGCMNPEPQGVQAVPCLSVASNDKFRKLVPRQLHQVLVV